MVDNLVQFILKHNFIAVCGDMGSGKTLSVVAILALSESKNIVSNTQLYGIKHEILDLSKLFDYKDKIVFWDMNILGYTSSKKEADRYHDNITGFINELYDNKNHLIITEQDSLSIEPNIAEFVDLWIWTNYEREHDSISLFMRPKVGKVVYGKLGKVSQWFKNYETLALPLKSINEVVKWLE